MRFNPRARSDGTETTRRSGGTGGTGLPGLGGGRLTLGGVVAAGVIFLLAQVTGVDISALAGGSGDESGSSVVCTGAEANAATTDDCAVSLLTTSIQGYWTSAFDEQVDGPYAKAETILFNGSTQSGCGAASSATGPFYCPRDQKIYLDTNFMADMLEGDLGARGGTFALAYVVAHEYGHHVENLLGKLPQDNRTGADSDAVRTELMADCLGGMWARSAQSTTDDNGTPIIAELTQDDIARAVDAATAVGDDRIQQRSGGEVDPDGWTHGSSAQRVKWFTIGLTQGSLQACDTFSARTL